MLQHSAFRNTLCGVHSMAHPQLYASHTTLNTTSLFAIAYYILKPVLACAKSNRSGMAIAHVVYADSDCLAP